MVHGCVHMHVWMERRSIDTYPHNLAIEQHPPLPSPSLSLSLNNDNNDIITTPQKSKAITGLEAAA